MSVGEHTPRSSDRRAADRRTKQLTELPFPDRRQNDRRTGADRRKPKV